MTTQIVYVCKFHSVLLGCDLTTIWFNETDARNFQAQNGGNIYTMKILVDVDQLI